MSRITVQVKRDQFGTFGVDPDTAGEPFLGVDCLLEVDHFVLRSGEHHIVAARVQPLAGQLVALGKVGRAMLCQDKLAVQYPTPVLGFEQDF